MNVLALIPARKGSKRLPNKNTSVIVGKTLVEHAIDHAWNSYVVGKVVVLSADEKVKEIVSKCKGVFFEDEPEEFCKDDTQAEEYVRYIESKYMFDVLVLLQPTSPVRFGYDIDKCVRLLVSDDTVNSVVTVSRRLKYCFVPNGNVFVIRRGCDFYSDSMVCVVQDETTSVDVDTEFNFNVAKMVLEGEKK